MKFKIADIQPNPFRHMDRYPIRRDKVKALRESMRTTDFWDNVVARIDGYGKPQIAYGHHRLVALREEYAPDHEVDLIIRDLDDTHMLQVMARENLEEWGTSAAVEHETVRAVVEALAKEQITLPQPAIDNNKRAWRYAPSFTVGGADSDRSESPYTAKEIAEFLPQPAAGVPAVASPADQGESREGTVVMATFTCSHCGQTCGDYAGGYAGVAYGDGPMLHLCHPNDASRPDCYWRVTVWGEPVGTLTGVEPKPAGVEGVVVAASSNPEYQSALQDAESESWEGPGVDVTAMIKAADERRRAAERRD